MTFLFWWITGGLAWLVLVGIVVWFVGGAARNRDRQVPATPLADLRHARADQAAYDKRLADIESAECEIDITALADGLRDPKGDDHG